MQSIRHVLFIVLSTSVLAANVACACAPAAGAASHVAAVNHGAHGDHLSLSTADETHPCAHTECDGCKLDLATSERDNAGHTVQIGAVASIWPTLTPTAASVLRLGLIEPYPPPLRSSPVSRKDILLQ